jgi:hypothetical protein
MDLSQFKFDPNDLYLATHGGMHTLLYTQNGNLYEDRNDTHYDMMANPKIFKDVWDIHPDEFDLVTGEASEKAWSQSRVGNRAVMARAGVFNGQPIISLWVHSTHPLYEEFLIEFLKKHPEFKDAVVVPYKEEPVLLGDQLTVSAPVKKSKESKYVIDGKTYTRNDITQLRSAWHTQPWKREELKAIFCHPDMHKYPDLIQLIPPGCDPPPKQKSWYQAIKQSFPVETHLHFKEWHGRNEKVS